MNKFILIAVLCLSLEFATSSQLNCDKSDVAACKREIGKIFDRDMKIAHLTSINRFVRRYIDVCRDLINQNAQDKEYTENLRKIITDLKTELEHIHENWNNNEEVLKIVNRIRAQLRKDVLLPRNSPNADDKLQRVLENREFEDNFKNSLRVMIEELTWKLREINEELKDKDIKIDDDLNSKIDELVRYVKASKNIDINERIKKFNEYLKNITENLDVQYAKGAQLEHIEQLRKEWQ